MNTLIELDNPYWDEVRDMVDEDPYFRGDFSLANPMGSKDRADRAVLRYVSRTELVKKYSWCVTDPDSVEFVFDHARGRIVDPMAGTGYWSYLLSQMGVQCFAYDLKQGQNTGHRSADEHFPIIQGEAGQTVMAHDDCTLFLCWPPYDDPAGYAALSNYGGNRVIYIGEGDSGCTGDDKFHKLLDKEWGLVDTHKPMQWWGLHDWIYVYAQENRKYHG